jgi:hypothetical protein
LPFCSVKQRVGSFASSLLFLPDSVRGSTDQKYDAAGAGRRLTLCLPCLAGLRLILTVCSVAAKLVETAAQEQDGRQAAAAVASSSRGPDRDPLTDPTKSGGGVIWHPSNRAGFPTVSVRCL